MFRNWWFTSNESNKIVSQNNFNKFHMILLSLNKAIKEIVSDIKAIWNHSYLVRKRTLSHLVNLAKWLSCVVSIHLYSVFNCMLLSCQIESTLYSLHRIYRIPLLPLKLHIWCLPRARSSLTFRQTIECRFTLKLVLDMIIRYSWRNCIYFWNHVNLENKLTEFVF